MIYTTGTIGPGLGTWLWFNGHLLYIPSPPNVGTVIHHHEKNFQIFFSFANFTSPSTIFAYVFLAFLVLENKAQRISF